jgi:hypothetical protein
MSQGQDDVHIDAENLGGANNDPTADERADFDSACITVNGNCTTSIDPTENETGSADVCFWVDEESDASHHVNGRVRDGGGCAATALNAAENGHTDVISVGWGSRTNATVAVPQGTKNFDARFAVSGTVGSANPDCVGGLEVRVQRDVLGGASTYQNWKTTTTSDSGGYRVNGKADRSARYRARAIDAPPCLEDFSGAKIVRVAKKLTLRAPKAVGRGQIARITGKIAPCKGHKGDRITLLHKKGGSFRVLDKAKSNANCVAAFSIRINRTRVFKVRAPKTEPWLLGGTSRPKKVRAS